MEGTRSATINLAYNIIGTASAGIAKIRADMEEIDRLAKQGISIQSAGVGMSGSRSSSGSYSDAGTRWLNREGEQSGLNRPWEKADDAARNALSRQRLKAYDQMAKDAIKHADESRSIQEKAIVLERKAIADRDKVLNSLAAQRRREETAESRANDRAASQMSRSFQQLRQRRANEQESSANDGGKDDDDKPGKAIRTLTALFLLRMAINEFVSAVQGATSALNQLNRADLSQSQRGRAAIEEIPGASLIFKTAANLAGARNGDTERIRASNQNLTLARVIGQNEVGEAGLFNQLDMRQAQAQARADALGGVSARTVMAGDRSTFAGQVAYEEQERRRPRLAAMDVANAEVAAARRAQMAGRGQIAETQNELDLIRRRERELRYNQGTATREEQQIAAVNNRPGSLNRLSLVGGGPLAALSESNRRLNQAIPAVTTQVQRAETGNELLAIQEKRLGFEKEIERLQRQQLELTQARGQAETRARTAVINSLKEEIGILQDREQRMSQGATRIAAMGPVNRMVGMWALEQIVQAGPQNYMSLPSFIQNSGRQIGPNIVTRIEEQAGQNAPEFARLRQLGEFGGGPQNNLDEMRRDLRDAINALSDRELKNLQQTANSELGAINGTLGDIKRAIVDQGRVRVNIVGTNVYVQNANQF